jgi:hypothetical protein
MPLAHSRFTTLGLNPGARTSDKRLQPIWTETAAEASELTLNTPNSSKNNHLFMELF